jgi:hypothetical protein
MNREDRYGRERAELSAAEARLFVSGRIEEQDKRLKVSRKRQSLLSLVEPICV